MVKIGVPGSADATGPIAAVPPGIPNTTLRMSESDRRRAGGVVSSMLAVPRIMKPIICIRRPDARSSPARMLLRDGDARAELTVGRETNSRSWTHKCSRCAHLQYLHATSYCVLTSLGRRDCPCRSRTPDCRIGRRHHPVPSNTFLLPRSGSYTVLPRVLRRRSLRRWLIHDTFHDARPLRLPASAPGH